VKSEAIPQTQEDEEEERRAFRPRLLVVHPRFRVSAVIVALTMARAFEAVELPAELPSLPWEEQLGRVREEIRAHQARWATDAGVKVAGGISGYWYEDAFGTYVCLTTEGAVVEKVEGVVTGEIRVRVR
jgi:hypothetical protein